jgi:regulator of sirC expression with transglutaminase-like and TPR domain
MFFPRLRKQVKWMFVFLALVFAVGFVVFNVGSGGGGTGIGDLLLNKNSSSGIASVKDAQARIAKNPSDSKAYLDLATALETEGKSDQAISALERYTALRPKDESGLNRLASAYRTKVTKLQQEVQQIQLEAQTQLPSQFVAPPLEVKPGQPLVQPPLDQRIFNRYSGRLQKLLSDTQMTLGKAVSAYQRAAKLSPTDPSLQLQLADTAQLAQQPKVALGAYRKFLRLAPDDTNAGFVKQQIRQLEASTKASARASTPSK